MASLLGMTADAHLSGTAIHRFLLVNGALTENITSNSYFIIKWHINIKFHTFIKALNHY